MIETMVAMAISSVLVLGSITIYNNARGSYRTAENIARLQESMRFAIDTLDQDVRLAGYWGRTVVSNSITADPAVRVMCDGDDVTPWAIGQVATGIDASDDAFADLPCPGTNPRANSDVLVVRHAGTDQTTIEEADQVQVLADYAGGQIFSNGILPAPIDPDRNQLYDVVVNAYYVSNQSKYNATLPSLRRRSLVGTTMQDQEIITGIENLQVQFGVDRDGDGVLDGYIDDDRPGKGPGDANVISVRLWMLVRGDADESGQGYVDDNVYATPDADGFLIAPDAGAEYPQNYRRYAFTKTIMLQN